MLASRPRLEKLRPIRGLLDREGLERYILWSERPETVGFEPVSADEVLVRAAAGPLDVMLMRLNAVEGWRAWRDGREVPLKPDPMGFVTYDPGGPGPVELTLRRAGNASPVPEWRAPRLEWTAGEFPAIAPEGVVDARSFSGPPFAAGTDLTIFGAGFDPRNTVVEIGGRGIEPGWASETQINFRLPADEPAGRREVVVVSDGRRSYPAWIEAAP